MGWPPQPVVWQICRWEVVLDQGIEILGGRGMQRTILYMGTEPYESATVPKIKLSV